MATMLSQKLVEAQEANDTVRDFSEIFPDEKQARTIASPDGCSASSVIKCFTAKKHGEPDHHQTPHGITPPLLPRSRRKTSTPRPSQQPPSQRWRSSAEA